MPEDDLAYFVIEAVDRLPLESFRVNHRGTHRDVAIRYLTAGTHPDHDTICKFRRENLEAFRESFVDVLELARELKLLKLGNVSLDGTHLKANASIDKNVSYQRAVKIREQLRLDIDDLLAQAESADAEEQDSQKLPEEIARREKLASKMERVIEELKPGPASASKRPRPSMKRRKQSGARRKRRPARNAPAESRSALTRMSKTPALYPKRHSIQQRR